MNKKIQGYIMAIIGFALLFYNTLGYLFDWDSRNAALTIMGLIFVTIGLKQTRKF